MISPSNSSKKLEAILQKTQWMVGCLNKKIFPNLCDLLKEWHNKLDIVPKAQLKFDQTAEQLKDILFQIWDDYDRQKESSFGQILDDLQQQSKRHAFLVSPLDWNIRLKIASDIAAGMSHLHSLDPPIIHRDLKSPNVLLTAPLSIFQKSVSSEDWSALLSLLEKPLAKVCDFGLSRCLFGDELPTIGKFSSQLFNPTWLAPEVLEGKGTSAASDVYGFGIILWELISREEPFQAEVAKKEPFSPPGFIKEFVLNGGRPRNDEWWPEEYCQLISRCLNQIPEERPSMSEIAEDLFIISKTLAPDFYSVCENDNAEKDYLLSSLFESAPISDSSPFPEINFESKILFSTPVPSQEDWKFTGTPSCSHEEPLSHPARPPQIRSLVDACSGKELWVGLQSGRVGSFSWHKGITEETEIAWSQWEDSHLSPVHTILHHTQGGLEQIWSVCEHQLKVWLAPAVIPQTFVEHLRLNGNILVQKKRGKKWGKMFALLGSGELQLFQSFQGREEQSFNLIKDLWKVERSGRAGEDDEREMTLIFKDKSTLCIRAGNCWWTAFNHLMIAELSTNQTRVIFPSATASSRLGFAAAVLVQGDALVLTNDRTVVEYRFDRPSSRTGVRRGVYEIAPLRSFKMDAIARPDLRENLVRILVLSDKARWAIIGKRIHSMTKKVVRSSKLKFLLNKNAPITITSICAVRFALQDQEKKKRNTDGLLVRMDMNVWIGFSDGSIAVLWVDRHWFPHLRYWLSMGEQGGVKSEERRGNAETRREGGSPVTCMTQIIDYGRVLVGRGDGSVQVWTIHGDFCQDLNSGVQIRNHGDTESSIDLENREKGGKEEEKEEEDEENEGIEEDRDSQDEENETKTDWENDGDDDGDEKKGKHDKMREILRDVKEKKLRRKRKSKKEKNSFRCSEEEKVRSILCSNGFVIVASQQSLLRTFSLSGMRDIVLWDLGQYEKYKKEKKKLGWNPKNLKLEEKEFHFPPSNFLTIERKNI